jgi:hypothetical protein
MKRCNDSVIDLEEGGPSNDGRAPQPRGHKASKQVIKCEASVADLESTLKVVMAKREEAYAKREDNRLREKEEQMINFIEIERKSLEVQERKLQVEEINARSRAKEIEVKEQEVEATLLAEENRIMMSDLSLMNSETRAWFQKKQAMIRSRDTVSNHIFIYFALYELLLFICNLLAISLCYFHSLRQNSQNGLRARAAKPEMCPAARCTPRPKRTRGQTLPLSVRVLTHTE